MAREEFCIKHPDSPAETRCRQCHKPVCKACVKSDANGQFCSFECSEKFKDFQQREVAKGKKGGSLIVKLVILVLIVLAAIVIGKWLGCDICENIVDKVKK